jgi:hypothetical protein
MFNYIHILSYFKLFLSFHLCISVMDILSCSIISISFFTSSCSFTLICTQVWWIVYHVHLHLYSFLLQTVPFLSFVYKCDGYSIMFNYIHILSYFKLFIYLNLYTSVMDSLSCSFTSISFLTTSCSFTLICV